MSAAIAIIPQDGDIWGSLADPIRHPSQALEASRLQDLWLAEESAWAATSQLAGAVAQTLLIGAVHVIR